MSTRNHDLLSIAALAAAFVLPACAVGQGQPQNTARPNGSLWSSSSKGLCDDTHAHNVGDTITILVAESTTATSSAATKTSRADTASVGGMTGGYKTLNSILQPFGMSNSATTDGSGQTSRSGTLTTKLTVIVKEKDSKTGNLMVEGTRSVGVNAEKQTITIRGTIRPQDIAPDNTISSVYLANASVQVDGKGPIGDKQRKGLLSTVLHWLF